MTHRGKQWRDTSLFLSPQRSLWKMWSHTGWAKSKHIVLNLRIFFNHADAIGIILVEPRLEEVHELSKDRTCRFPHETIPEACGLATKHTDCLIVPRLGCTPIGGGAACCVGSAGSCCLVPLVGGASSIGGGAGSFGGATSCRLVPLVGSASGFGGCRLGLRGKDFEVTFDRALVWCFWGLLSCTPQLLSLL
jgi:hypothetical protein